MKSILKYFKPNRPLLIELDNDRQFVEILDKGIVKEDLTKYLRDIISKYGSIFAGEKTIFEDYKNKHPGFSESFVGKLTIKNNETQHELNGRSRKTMQCGIENLCKEDSHRAAVYGHWFIDGKDIHVARESKLGDILLFHGFDHGFGVSGHDIINFTQRKRYAATYCGTPDLKKLMKYYFLK